MVFVPWNFCHKKPLLLFSSYECVICKSTFDSYEDYKLHMKVACRLVNIKKEPPQLLDENSLLMSGGIMLHSDGVVNAADVIMGHLPHHSLHSTHHQSSPSYILT